MVWGEKAVNQTAMRMDAGKTAAMRWEQYEADVIERKRQTLRREKREIDRERRMLEREKREFSAHKRAMDSAFQKERQLFEMKWKILEEELKRLANDRQQVEKQRRFYDFVADHETRSVCGTDNKSGRVHLFFAGVKSRQALKKRYKDLLKIYHPDNQAGDSATVQEINREYERLQTQYP